MDQAAPAHQGLLRHQRERGEDANLDRGLGLRAGGHRPQAPGAEGQPLPNPTDLERDAFRENAHFYRRFSHPTPETIYSIPLTN